MKLKRRFLTWNCIRTGSTIICINIYLSLEDFLGHLVYVVLQNPVTNPIQSLNQAKLRFHIFSLLLFTEKQCVFDTFKGLSSICKRHQPGVTVARLYHPMWLLTLGKFTPKLYRHNLWLHFSGNTLQSHLKYIRNLQFRLSWFEGKYEIEEKDKWSVPCRPHRWKHTSHHTCPPPSLLQVKVPAAGQTYRDTRPTSSNNTFLKIVKTVMTQRAPLFYKCWYF